MLFVSSRPLEVKWEPSGGEMYAVLLTRVLEVYRVKDDTPLHSITFDSNQTGFAFVSATALVVCDDKGRVTLFTGIQG